MGSWASGLSLIVGLDPGVIRVDIEIGEGNGNPLQYSCLENPRDGGAWWAAIYGIAQSRTRLKRRSSSSSSSDEECEMPVRKMVRGMDLTHSLLRTQN